ncbi:MAG: hypothetical protein IH897_13720, partial [Planctomycetes bacterium]|nr:hypothetical protein [Planctomycetota bacterium]
MRDVRPDAHLVKLGTMGEYGTPNTPIPELENSEKEALIATLSTYCVGEVAALDGASGMIGFAPSRQAKIFLATQVADEA